ncbi:MAG: GntR family transcriptional regulator [Bacteroidota bacterium]
MHPDELINDKSSTPKYMQVLQLIISDIESGIYRQGEKIPSINETSEEYLIAKDTVEKAYRELRTRGIIKPVKGKGYFVENTRAL